MPIYEYDCPVCGRFEALQKVNSKPLKECPTCKEKGQKSAVQKVVSASSFHLKGTGWYKTDYASNGSATSSKSGKSGEASTKNESGGEATASTKSDTKSETAGKKGPCGSSCGCH